MNINILLNYKKLQTNCDLSSTGMQQAIQQFVGPSFVYELFVHPDNLIHAKTLLHRLDVDLDLGNDTAQINANPLRPHINLHTSDKLDRHEWVIGSGSNMAGSPGVG